MNLNKKLKKRKLMIMLCALCYQFSLYQNNWSKRDSSQFNICSIKLINITVLIQLSLIYSSLKKLKQRLSLKLIQNGKRFQRKSLCYHRSREFSNSKLDHVSSYGFEFKEHVQFDYEKGNQVSLKIKNISNSFQKMGINKQIRSIQKLDKVLNMRNLKLFELTLFFIHKILLFQVLRL